MQTFKNKWKMFVCFLTGSFRTKNYHRRPDSIERRNSHHATCPRQVWSSNLHFDDITLLGCIFWLEVCLVCGRLYVLLYCLLVWFGFWFFIVVCFSPSFLHNPICFYCDSVWDEDNRISESAESTFMPPRSSYPSALHVISLEWWPAPKCFSSVVMMIPLWAHHYLLNYCNKESWNVVSLTALNFHFRTPNFESIN